MVVNANSILQQAVEIKNWIIKHVDVSVKIIVHTKKIIVGIVEDALLGIVSI